MSKAIHNDKGAPAEELAGTFHQVHKLIPAEQNLVTIEPNMRVSDALKLMDKHRYSQLPVAVGQAILGVFSYRSFSKKALARQKTNGDERLGDLPVEDFLEEFEYVHGSQDWNHIVDYLNRDDAFFVGHQNGVDGLITTMDVLHYFREVASPFIILAEIEMSLRKIIETAIPIDKWGEALQRSLASAYQGKEVPLALGDMTFDNYVQIISNGDNWPYFEAFFNPGDVGRKQTESKLRELRDRRNDVFHLRGLEPWQSDKLSEHRTWLQRRMRAFEAKRIQNTTPAPVAERKQSKLTREELLKNSEPAAAEVFSGLLDLTQLRAIYYAIEWHPSSFSVRLRSDGKPVGLLYGYAPRNLDVYLGYLKLPPEKLAELRRIVLGSGMFRESGAHTLKAEITESDTLRLLEFCDYLTDWLIKYVLTETS